MRKNKLWRAWYFYDFANSAYSTTVITVFLGPFLTDLAKSASNNEGFISVLGIEMAAGSLFPYAVSLSVLIQVLVLPIIGAVADHVQSRSRLMGLLASVGSITTMLFYFISVTNYQWAALLLIISNVAMGASIVVYNSFLPDIAAPEERDQVSARGWGLGYLGGGLLLALNVVLYLSASTIGIAEGDAVRISLLSAGAWWFLFTRIPIKGLKALDRDSSRFRFGGIKLAFKDLRSTFQDAKRYPHTVRYLIAYLIYNDGIQTVIAMAGTFAAEELGLPQTDLIIAILIVQFVALFGALGLGKLAVAIGARKVLMSSLLIWTVMLVFAYLLPRGAALLYYLLAALIGIVLGGSQSLSRSLFSQMIPRAQEAQYFAIYELSERGTSWIGTFLFGLSLTLTGSYRISILALISFFIIGGILFSRVNLKRAIQESGNELPPVI